MTPGSEHFPAVAEATWPAAQAAQLGPWIIRAGQGGGKRVSAATATGPVRPRDLPQAEAAMRALDQVPLFMIRAGDDDLDALLDSEGYEIADPVNVYAAAVGVLSAEPPPPVTTWCIWEPLAIMNDIWSDGGIGPARRAVMARAAPPKTAILGRVGSHAAAAGFVGMHAGTAMMHALEVRPAHRRVGMARHMMRAAAMWTEAQGGHYISALCTRSNSAACALYASLGMRVVGQYHYRRSPKER